LPLYPIYIPPLTYSKIWQLAFYSYNNYVACGFESHTGQYRRHEMAAIVLMQPDPSAAGSKPG
jgi:hypothetical protein